DTLDVSWVLCTVCPGLPFGRIEVDHRVVGLLGGVDARETRMDLDRGVVGHPHQRRHVVGKYVVVLRLPRIGPALDPARRELRLALLVEVRAVDAVRGWP